MKRYKLLFLFSFFVAAAFSQETYPVNGVQDYRQGYVAFTHATIVKDSKTTLKDATLVIREGKIISVGNNMTVPKEAAVVDCKGKYIYPSFIDLFSNYGITVEQQPQRNTDFSERNL
jgi:imidazolonepropionase-like amidohydrolase